MTLSMLAGALTTALILALLLAGCAPAPRYLCMPISTTHGHAMLCAPLDKETSE